MHTLDNLQQRVPAGQIIKPWLILGPMYEDMSSSVEGLTLFERAGATVGVAAMTEVAQEATQLLARARPREAGEDTFRGQRGTWSLVRRPEKYLSWGTYNIANTLGAAFLSTRITPERPGERQWRLALRITSRIMVTINGEQVFDGTAHPGTAVDGVYEFRFSAPLSDGENVVNVAVFRLGRMAQVGLRLECTDSDLEARVEPPDGLPFEERARLEEEVRGLRLDTDVFYPHQAVALRMERAPAGRVAVRLYSAEGDLLREVAPSAAGEVILCQGEDIRDGHYRIECAWYHRERQVTSVSFDVHKVTPAPRLTGDEHYEQRRRLVLEHYAQHLERRPIWSAVARYALGRYDEVDESVIRETCEFIAARKDCADFVIQGILRLMYWERTEQRLSPEINAMMKDTVLGFKYWVDEPGDTVMYMGSENHRLLFHVAEWLAGQLFPTEEFTNSRMRGLYHATKGRMYITEWLRQRGRYGFDEWHSNSYYPISMAPLFNVYDFAIYEDAKLRDMAGCVLDYMFLNLAQDSLDGILGTTHGRSYGIYVKYPDFEGTSSTCWLAWGTGSLTAGTSGMCPVSMATSNYRVPSILTHIALDDRSVIESRERQGYHRGASAPHANLVVYRTPDYLISGVQDLRKGEYEPSTHVAQVTLRGKRVIFWSCPHTSGEGSGLRPDYWSGHTTLPRVIQHRNVMSLTWHLSEYAWMSHCFFEMAKYDEVRLDVPANGPGTWAFAKADKGYVAIWSQNGYVVGEDGQYAGRELQCAAEDNTWLVECGREADWGSFEAFADAVARAPVSAQNGVITYRSPSIGTFVTGWDVAPSVDEEPIALRDYALVESNWAYSEYDSGRLEMRYGDERYMVYMGQ